METETEESPDWIFNLISLQVLERKAKALQQLGQNCEDEVDQLNQLIQKVTFKLILFSSDLSQGLVPEDKLKALNATLLNFKKTVSAPKGEGKLTEPKAVAPVLSDSVKVCETAEQGRYLVATRDIAVGEQVGSTSYEHRHFAF